MYISMGKMDGLTHRTLVNALRFPDSCMFFLLFVLHRYNALSRTCLAPDTGTIIQEAIIPAVTRLRRLIHLSLPEVTKDKGCDIDCTDLAMSDAYFGVSSYK